MMDLNAEEIAFVIKIIDLDTKIFAEKTMVPLVFKIDNSNIHIVMVLINQDTTVLF